MTGTLDSAPVIVARQLRKTYGQTVALGGIDLRVEPGRIVGLIGANGAGKTTLLNAILGLASFEGELDVLGRNPWNERSALMPDVSFIADVAVLPKWIKVNQLLEYVSGVHPRFDRARADQFLRRTSIKPAGKVKDLSKGMVTQLHLAVAMAIDAQLLVLDEPTLGLDIIYRKEFYDSLLDDCYERRRTIILATHSVEEIQHVVTDVILLDRGRIAVSATMEEVESRFREVRVHPDQVERARSLLPIHERESLGQRIMLFDAHDYGNLAELGEARTPGLADLMVGLVTGGEQR